MKESGFATAIEKLGAIILELERELEMERYLHDEAKKENATLRHENMKLREENYTLQARMVELAQAEEIPYAEEV